MYMWISPVVLYLHSTSNHNHKKERTEILELYYIFILHQTTTRSMEYLCVFSCIISSFYIKPQLWCRFFCLAPCCIISSFYIKPQLPRRKFFWLKVVLYLHSTSNHNRRAQHIWRYTVVLYLHSTSNHNFRRSQRYG